MYFKIKSTVILSELDNKILQVRTITIMRTKGYRNKDNATRCFNIVTQLGGHGLAGANIPALGLVGLVVLRSQAGPGIIAGGVPEKVGAA